MISINFFSRSGLAALVIAGALAGLAASGPAPAREDPAHHANHHGDAHAHHAQMLKQKGYARMQQVYKIPDVTLTDEEGRRVALRAALEGEQPVILNFIFTTCTTICPVLSATFTQVQQELGPGRDDVRMISISIDPEHDTPERLRVYAERFGAGPQWAFLTGRLDDIVAVQKAFDAYRGNKLNHAPLTFLRASEAEPWMRLDGIASAADVMKEYGQLLKQ